MSAFVDDVLHVLPEMGERVTDWGAVTQVSPLRVRLSADNVADIKVPLASAGLTLTEGAVVGLVKFGSQWCAVAVLVAS